MIHSPYTLTTVDQISPGDRIHDPAEDRTLVVSEIRRQIDGYYLLCYPAHRPDSGRRASLVYTPGDDVILLSNDEEDYAIIHELAALTIAGNKQAGEVRWDFDSNAEAGRSALHVTAEGRLWTVPIPTGGATIEPPLVPVPDAPVDEEAPGA